MNDLKHLDMRQILPSSITGDLNIQGIAESTTRQLIDIAEKIDLLLILANLSKLPEAAVDQLAWHYSVDYYDVTLPRSVKEELLYQSIAWHRRKGTVKIVEEMVAAVHSHGRVVENWEYGGQPYHFKIIVEGEPIEDTSILNNLIRSIESVKNVRSWLDGIEYEKGITMTMFYGGATYIHKEVIIDV